MQIIEETLTFSEIAAVCIYKCFTGKYNVLKEK